MRLCLIIERESMETVVIKYEIFLDEWRNMKESEIDRIVRFRSGTLYDATCDGSVVTLYILAPITYRTIILDNMLRQYRYC